VLAEFGSAVDAVQCAVEAQKALAAANAGASPDRRINFRIGIHVGDVMVKGGDLFGDGVNIAARLQTLASAGGVCVSGAAHDQVRKILSFTFNDLGAQQVKNIEEPVRAYAVGPPGLAAAAAASRDSAPLALPDKPSIAVLPFQNMSGDPEQEYFADGMVEEITTAIARLPWLFVIARNSSFTYKGKVIDLKQIGRELGVRYALEGSVRKSGNRVRITGQLIDTTDGAHIWADHFDGGLDDIFELQDQVAGSVVGAIEPRLRLSEIKRSTRKPTDRLDAYDLYLRALAQVHKLTPDANQHAIELSRSALEIDPTYAPAAGLSAWCRTVQKWQGWIAPGGSEYTEGVRLARQAIESGVQDPDMLWMAGFTLAYLAADYTAAVTAIDRALALNVNSANAWRSKGMVASFLGQADPAIKSLERAMRLSPLDPLGYHCSFGIGLAHLSAGRYEEATKWIDRALGEQPKFHAGLRVKVALCGLVGLEQGREWLSRLREAQPDLTVARFVTHAATFLSKGLTAAMVDGLRKAGLPEN
jgi:TolB-like protein/tetratricopeptide (TPR) repeat protein